MPVPASYSQPALQVCIDSAVRQSQALIAQLLLQVRAALQEDEAAADAQQRPSLVQTLRALRQYEAALAHSYPHVLQALLAGDRAMAARAALLQTQPELVRAQGVVVDIAESAFAELQTWLQPQPGEALLWLEANPLHPGNYFAALLLTMEHVGVELHGRPVWVRYAHGFLGRLLASAYRELAHVLQQRQAERATASGYHRPYASSGVGAIGPMGAVGYGVAASQHGVLPSQGYWASGGANAQQEQREALEDVAELERLLEQLSGGTTSSQPLPEGTGWGQIETPQEVVARMVHNLTQDPRLLPPVRQAMYSLAPALHQLVSVDTRFFTDEQHPARQVLDWLTQRSVGFYSESAPGFDRFMRVVQQVVQHLTARPVRSASRFQKVLDALQAYEEKQQGRKQPLHKQRERLAESIAANFRQLEGADQVPMELMAFLTGPWADVVAQTQIQHLQDPASASSRHDSDPGGYLALVPLLVHSAQPEMLRADPARLGVALAHMAPTVRQGLESIAYPQERIAQVLNHLAQLEHQALEFVASQSFAASSLEGGAGGGAASAPAVTPLPVEQARPPEPAAKALADFPELTEQVPPPQSQPQPPPTPEFEPLPVLDEAVPAAEVGQAAESVEATDTTAQADAAALATAAFPPLETDGHGVDGDTAAPAATQPQEAQQQAQAEPAFALSDLKVGQWVHLETAQGALQTRLNWCSPNHSLFLFEAADGRTQSLTRRMLERLVQDGACQPIARPAAARATGGSGSSVRGGGTTKPGNKPK